MDVAALPGALGLGSAFGGQVLWLISRRPPRTCVPPHALPGGACRARSRLYFFAVAASVSVRLRPPPPTPQWRLLIPEHCCPLLGLTGSTLGPSAALVPALWALPASCMEAVCRSCCWETGTGVHLSTQRRKVRAGAE